MKRFSLLIVAAVLTAMTASAALAGPQAASADATLARYQPEPYVKIKAPEWTKSATLYQVNLRQFTPEGTLAAAELQLPRIKALGADIVWLMPVHPIGEKNRKGSLGSPYSVRDYLAVNPEFGTLDDLKRFVARAHGLGMYVILDWVANHSAWDNPLVASHPEWYERDWKGDFHPTSWWDWSDIIEFDYSQPGLRHYMTEAMKFWVREADVDGFRCDVASYVPLDFWNNVRAELDAIKPVFMLAEASFPEMHARAFDATYAWAWNDALHHIWQGTAGVVALPLYYSERDNAYPREAMRLMMVSNHDKNAWEGTEFERFGDAVPAAMVLSFVGDGIPMIYNGQEAGNTKRLKFFDRDPIEWREHPNGELYRRLTALKKQNSALWNGAWGARMVPVANDQPDAVISFVRTDDSHKVFAAFNFTPRPVKVGFLHDLHAGRYVDGSTGAAVTLERNAVLELPAWGYAVYVR
jgi:glycosidase